MRASKFRGYLPVMNDTKWDALRLAMASLPKPAPQWRTRDLESGYVSAWDRDWFYHFREGGYSTIEWVGIRCDNPAQIAAVNHHLAQIHVPVERTDDVFKVYGFIVPGESVDYANTEDA
jgi:hypothetical protein